MPKKKIVIAAGGTGGHIFPAIGLAEQLAALTDAPDLLFAAGGLATNRYFDRSQFDFQEIACAPLLSKHPLKLLKGLYKLGLGTKQACKLIDTFKADLVVAFGSFYTVPILLAAKLKKVPFILHEANSIPGKANRWFAPYAAAVGVHFSYTANSLKGNVYEVGMPLRAGFKRENVSKQAALDYYGFNPHDPVLLIFGGSQGAQAINRWVEQCQLPVVQVLHFTGSGKDVDRYVSHYRSRGLKAVVKPFESEMQKAWGCADLFLARAGAATIAEAIEFEVPGVLIPFPYATDNHQELNARFLVEKVGSAYKFQESDLTSTLLSDALQKVLIDGELLQQNVKTFKARPHQLDLCKLVLNHLGNGS